MAYYNYNPYQQFMQFQQPQQQPQIIRVQSEQEARQYPVSPGNSVTFIDENAPYCYSKSMGFSQLEPPVFEKYRLVKEDANSVQNVAELPLPAQGIDLSLYALKTDTDELKALYGDLKAMIESMKKPAKKKEVTADESPV